MIGRKFAKLTVMEDAGYSNGNKMYSCICDCGSIKIIRGGHLLSGHTKSCGGCRPKTDKRTYRRWFKQKTKSEHPEKPRANKLIANALRSGRIIAPTSCSICLRVCKLHAHHDDYEKPYDVRWLCATCHARVHAKLTETQVSKIKALYRSGSYSQPMLANMFNVKTSTIASIIQGNNWIDIELMPSQQTVGSPSGGELR